MTLNAVPTLIQDLEEIDKQCHLTTQRGESEWIKVRTSVLASLRKYGPVLPAQEIDCYRNRAGCHRMKHELSSISYFK